MPRSLRSLALFSAFLLLSSLIAAHIWAQSAQTAAPTSKDDPERREAMDLYQQGKFVDAMPLLEKLAAKYPNDPGLREGWAWCMFEYAATLPDPEQRQKVRARARTIAVKAKELGDDSQILQLMLEQPEDGGTEAKFSERQEVDEAMKTAEADFARGEMDKAREGYLRVLLIDPNNYEAALFIGDVYFKQHVYGSAGEWFANAIKIDPNRETAYRYWGDALAATDKNDEARAKFIDAIVAEPYNNRSWFGLTNWLKHNQLQLNMVRLKDRASFTPAKDNKGATITLDSSLGKDDPSLVAWVAYGGGRAGWHTEKSEKEFPNVPRNRQTLQEEAQALRLMVTVLKEQKDEKKLKELDPSLQALIKIEEAGFLDPFVLLNRANAEIAQDYEAYRAAHRDLIRRYLDEYVVPKTPAAK